MVVSHLIQENMSTDKIISGILCHISGITWFTKNTDMYFWNYMVYFRNYMVEKNHVVLELHDCKFMSFRKFKASGKFGTCISRSTCPVLPEPHM
jgi:hypothetical protein